MLKSDAVVWAVDARSAPGPAISFAAAGRVAKGKQKVLPGHEGLLMIRHCRYVIAVPDLRRSADYYHDVLGFEVVRIPDTGWRILHRDECVIMAGECPDALSPDALGDHSYFAYLEVDDIEKLYTSLVTNGADVVKALRLESWGLSEFGIRTVDGHRIMFGSPAT